MPDQTTKPTVFISYSHKDEVWKDRLLPQLKALEQAGRIAVWDDRKIDGGDKWYPEIKDAMERAAVAVCLITPDYLASPFCVKEEVPYLLERCETDGLVFLPLLVRPCVWKAFDWLKERQMLPRDGKTVARDFKDDWDTPFGEVANYIFEIADGLRVKSFSMVASMVAPGAVRWPPPEKIEIRRLPVTGSDLFGRQKELALLDEAWESPTTNLISFVAWGGVGKSTLINKWLERMAADNYRGARRVYAWSFYSQGSSERVTSADQFINAALEWFGDKDPLAGSPWDKGERLARLVRREKTLLLLDGMEPLQSPHSHERGKIKDPALATLVEELARENDGLCVITTREQIADLDESTFVVPPSGGGGISTGSGRDRVRQINLELLSPEAGRALLRVGGVRGTDEELERATEDFGCHALALNLLATYLQDIPGHPISAAAQIPDLDVPEAEGKHPRRVIAAFEQKFGEGPEVEVLRLLGLFDRPADGASIAALRKAPKIPKLTDHTSKADEVKWLQAVRRLRKYRLIAAESHHDPEELDAHPLMREHFRVQFKQNFPDSWREANNRLYEYLTCTAKEFPDTMEEMAPLFTAVARGCEAGRHQEALVNVYQRRIQRGEEFFSNRKLGTFSAELAALANFFDISWQRLVPGLTDVDNSFVLKEAGFELLAVGFLREAFQAMQLAFASNISLGNSRNAAITASYLSDIHLALGELTQALLSAQQSLELAIQSGDKAEQVCNIATLGGVLHQSGRFADAEVTFRWAESLQKELEPLHPILYSSWGYLYCDLLIDQGHYQQVLTRSLQTIEWVKNRDLLLDTALDNLSIGRTYLTQTHQERTGDYTKAADFLKQAVDGLRKVGDITHLPRGLLARAELYRLIGDYSRSQATLDKAIRIAERSQMRLHLTDCHLEQARLCLAQGDRDKAREHWTTAKEMIEQIGYHRRDRDLEEIARGLA